jgi:hypothetical protein
MRRHRQGARASTLRVVDADLDVLRANHRVTLERLDHSIDLSGRCVLEQDEPGRREEATVTGHRARDDLALGHHAERGRRREHEERAQRERDPEPRGQ